MIKNVEVKIFCCVKIICLVKKDLKQEKTQWANDQCNQCVRQMG